ncbi:MAG: ABC transporter ATP-binding protein [Lachnospiraceae bacterium]
MNENKRKRASIFRTIQRAVNIVYLAGHFKDLVFVSVWILIGALTSYTAVLNAEFLNAAADFVVNGNQALKSVIFWLLIWGGAELFLSVMDIFADRATGRMWVQIGYFVEKRVLGKVLKLKLSYFDDVEVQKKISLVKHGFTGKISGVVDLSLYSLKSAVSFGTALLILISLNWKIACLVFAATVPTLWLSRYQTEEEYKLNQWNSFEGQMQRYLALVLTKRKYVKEMRFYQLYDYVEQKYDQSVNKVYGEQIKLTRRFLLLSVLTNLLVYGSVACALAMICMDIFSGKSEIGSFMLVYSSVNNMRNYMRQTYQNINRVGSDGRYLEDYEEIMNYQEEKICGSSDNDEDVEITFEHVSFRYPGSDREVLHDVNLTIRQGEKIAIVGENGSGKSTFVALLMGLYEPTEGRILVNGKDLNEQLSFLRDRVSCTTQDFLHYQGTINENIEIGDLRHSHAESDIQNVLQKVHLQDYVDALEKQGNTYLGNLYEGSIDLSGGQWQKLVIARNLYKDQAKIMVLDEPTAALDPVSESELYSEFANLTADKTVLLISHRLGAAQVVDRILVFDDGSVVDDGTHSSLLGRDSLFAKMYQAQAQWYVNQSI